MKKKLILIVAAAMLVVAIGVGGTLAYLTATSTVTNTFTIGNVALTLDETDPATGEKTTTGVGYTNLVPTEVITKDPYVRVAPGSQKCYLFAKLTETNAPATYLDYTVLLDSASGWIPLGADYPNIYYRVVDPLANPTPTLDFQLIKDDKITVKEAVGGTIALPTAVPEIKFTAYAVQFENVANAEAAWAILNPST
ncbi:MAG TPA: TasA family protein [Feifaniaceae bacterium]|nr:TasA family protein [Feifaniaceae bacterium]